MSDTSEERIEATQYLDFYRNNYNQDDNSMEDIFASSTDNGSGDIEQTELGIQTERSVLDAHHGLPTALRVSLYSDGSARASHGHEDMDRVEGAGAQRGSTWTEALRDLNDASDEHSQDSSSRRNSFSHDASLPRPFLPPARGSSGASLTPSTTLPALQALPTRLPTRSARPARPPRNTSDSSSSSMDRKRRLTAPDSPGRRSIAPAPRLLAERPRGSAEFPINLDSSPAGPVSSTTTSTPAPTSRRPPTETVETTNQNIELPPWQPDSEASNCPVCGDLFTMWTRRHHCRKCGRVVCAKCSPHRITIPRQFIVRDPREVAAGRSSIIDLIGEDDDDHTTMSSFGPFGTPHLGGGEVVRVCNPCVPDPNLSPPPQRSQTRSNTISNPYVPLPARPTQLPPIPNSSRPSVRGSFRYNPPVIPSNNSSGRSQTNPNIRPDVFGDRRVSFHNRSRVSDLFPPPPPPPNPYADAPGTRPTHQFAPSHMNQYRHQHSNSASAIPRYPNPPLVPPPGMQHPMQPAAPPRRQVAEEDECPVCGEELPPKGPNNTTVEREKHIQDCIIAHSSGPPSRSPNTATNAAIAASAATPTDAAQSSASFSLPNPRTRGMSNPYAASAAFPNRGQSSRQQRPGMVDYDASEKDCFGEDGEAQECVICFEEFEEGDRMARLTCFCKFHKACIMKWWDTKGEGSCPTHQLHD